MNFDFFSARLLEVREYRSGVFYWALLQCHLRQPGASGKSALISVDETTFFSDHFRSTHLVHPPEIGGLSKVEKTFGVKLPDDFKKFYCRWSQALLVLCESYWVMPSSEIIKTNLDWEFSLDGAPCNLIRFARCSENREQNFALRRKHPDAPWTVAMWDDMDYHEDDADAGMDRFDYRVTDPDFTTWLKRMLETDGTPWFPGREEVCETERAK